MTTTSPTVSVIIPAFNAARFLGDAIHSVACQAYPHLEIVVIDDGSTDETSEVVRAFPQVRYVRQSNRGIASARNTGVREARGELIAFLDADDLWTSNKLPLQLDALREHRDVQIVAGRVEQFIDDSCDQAIALPAESGEAYTAGAMLIRRDDFLRVGFLNPALRIGEFVDWHSRAMNFGLREYRLDEVVLRRRIHGGNTTLQRSDSTSDYLAVIKAHLDRKRKAS